jgi:ABC-type nitrate/sulfonate/bicarbonate transport system permease component
LLKIVMPAALPQIAAGVRIAIAIAIATMLIANMFGSSGGLGYFVILAQQSFDILATWAGLLMIGLVGVVLSGLFALLQHRALAWHRGWRGTLDNS